MAAAKRPQTETTKLRKAEERVRELEDAFQSITAIPPEYATWLGIAEYLAQNGLKRESSGTSPVFQSSGTNGPGDFGALLLVEAERKYMRRRARELARRIREFVDNDTEPLDE